MLSVSVTSSRWLCRHGFLLAVMQRFTPLLRLDDPTIRVFERSWKITVVPQYLSSIVIYRACERTSVTFTASEMRSAG